MTAFTITFHPSSDQGLQARTQLSRGIYPAHWASVEITRASLSHLEPLRPICSASVLVLDFPCTPHSVFGVK